ncbi:hypothetical protein [Streptosporangium roseum]|uniref:hypothetical protein n=1 Tax=Streptosporangium roseum TaxID=2001 RepID=UPI00332FB014
MPAWRAPDPPTTARVDAAWRRIETWPARNTPEDHHRLRPPATPRRVGKVGAALGFRLPDDPRASSLRHDGAEAVLFGPLYEPMSTALITR